MCGRIRETTSLDAVLSSITHSCGMTHGYERGVKQPAHAPRMSIFPHGYKWIGKSSEIRVLTLRRIAGRVDISLFRFRPTSIPASGSAGYPCEDANHENDQQIRPGNSSCFARHVWQPVSPTACRAARSPVRLLAQRRPRRRSRWGRGRRHDRRRRGRDCGCQHDPLGGDCHVGACEAMPARRNSSLGSLRNDSGVVGSASGDRQGAGGASPLG
jgi:hypothetical protein